jgi:hypothetical protein
MKQVLVSTAEVRAAVQRIIQAQEEYEQVRTHPLFQLW